MEAAPIHRSVLATSPDGCGGSVNEPLAKCPMEAVIQATNTEHLQLVHVVPGGKEASDVALPSMNSCRKEPDTGNQWGPAGPRGPAPPCRRTPWTPAAAGWGALSA